MIESPTPNVELTFEQLQQIETSKGILRNIEAETAIANKNLSVLQKEVIKATKEREYQEELLAGLQERAAEKDADLASVSEKVAEAAVSLAKVVKESEKLDKDAEKTRTELATREDVVLKAEKDLSEARTDFNKEKGALDKERASIEQAKAAFKSAVLTVTWN